MTVDFAQLFLSVLFSAACLLVVVLWVWRRPPLVRWGALGALAVGAVMMAVQSLPMADQASGDSIWYYHQQAIFARYLDRLSPPEIALEVGTVLTDRLLHTHDLIWSHAPAITKLNPSQLAVGALTLVVCDGWSLAPTLFWITLVALGLGVLLEAAIPHLPGWRSWAFTALVVATPAGAWFRSRNTKEPIILTATAIWGAAVIRLASGRPRLRDVLIVIASLLLMFLFRPPYVLVLLFCLVTGVLLSRTDKFTTWLIAGGLGVAMLLLAGFPALIKNSRAARARGFLSPHQLSSYYTEELIETRAEYGSGKQGGSNVLKTALRGGPASLIYLPQLVAIYALGPFPWQSGSALLNLGKVQAVIYWAIMALWLRNLLAWRRLDAQHRLMLWISGGIVIILSIAESNLGTGMRHRTTYEPLLFYAALCVAAPPRLWRRRRVPPPETAPP